ncbi:PREP1, partial [Symbiodinium pilosum]
MDEMRSANLDQGRLVEAGFELAKKKVYLRFQQGSSFYSTYPWNICKLLAYVMQPAGPARTGAIADSRRFARELLGSNLPSNTFADKFFNGTFKEQMEEWAGGAGPMPTALFRELLSYSLSLVAMQRLESRHHLVNLRLQPSRASSAAQVSAHLRRKLNNDIRDDRFRLRLERYLHEFEKLDALIQAAAAESKEVVDASMRAWQAHVKTTLSDGAYYAVPFDVSESATKYMVVQFVSAAPGAKKYMEKLTRWGTDAWQGQVAVANLGSLTAPAPSDRGADAESALAMAVADLFKHGFHNLYKFKDVNHVCQLSQEAILSAVAAEEVGPGSDDEGPGECCQLSIASDPLRLQAVFDVAREAISRSTPLPLPAEPLRRDAAHWLVAQELASHTSDGGL